MGTSELQAAIELALVAHDEALEDQITAVAAFGLAVHLIRETMNVNLRTACLVVEAALLARDITKRSHSPPG